jgi:pyruvate/2-oxoglutarate/acetoin dehydrogenase E1 component
MSYFATLTDAMTMLAVQPNSIFTGQGITLAGAPITDTLKGVPMETRIEFPVAEELQVGSAIGLALQGFLPLCFIPRWNFMLRASDAVVNHLDRLPIYSAGGYCPKVIIRTVAPSTEPFNPQAQHDDDFTDAFRKMLRTVEVLDLRSAEDIRLGYRVAVEKPGSFIMVEHAALYRS